MPIPNDALVLVVDGRKSTLLRNHGDEKQIDLRTLSHEERKDAKDHELKSDAPGTTGQSGGFGRPAYEETDYHQRAEDQFAEAVADDINRRALAGEIKGLAVIAPPRTLGHLRKHWRKETQQHILIEIDKEMTDRPTPDIEALLIGHSAPPS